MSELVLKINLILGRLREKNQKFWKINFYVTCDRERQIIFASNPLKSETCWVIGDRYPTRNITIVEQCYAGIQCANMFCLLLYTYTVYHVILGNCVLFKPACAAWFFVRKLVSFLTLGEYMTLNIYFNIILFIYKNSLITIQLSFYEANLKYNNRTNYLSLIKESYIHKLHS